MLGYSMESQGSIIGFQKDSVVLETRQEVSGAIWGALMRFQKRFRGCHGILGKYQKVPWVLGQKVEEQKDRMTKSGRARGRMDKRSNE